MDVGLLVVVVVTRLVVIVPIVVRDGGVRASDVVVVVLDKVLVVVVRLTPPVGVTAMDPVTLRNNKPRWLDGSTDIRLCSCTFKMRCVFTVMSGGSGGMSGG